MSSVSEVATFYPLWSSAILGAVLLMCVWYWKCGLSTDRDLALLDGPEPESWILGSQAVLVQSESGAANSTWRLKYGAVYPFKSCFGVKWLMLNDPRAIQHVLKGQTTVYHLEASLREFLRQITGKGIIYADGPDHDRQRRLLTPAFNTAFVKSLTPVFSSSAYRVVQQWQKLTGLNGGRADINAFHWMELLTMESIGIAAFGVRMGAIEGEEHELWRSYAGLVSTAFSRPSRLAIVLQSALLHLPTWIISSFDKLPLPAVRRLMAAKESSRQFAQHLIEEKREQIRAEPDMKEKDILTVLVKATDQTNSRLRAFADEETYAQMTTFFVAGYETAANTSTFVLYELARNPDIQSRLYSEIADVVGSSASGLRPDGFDHNTLEALPYLTAVINETLRLYSAVNFGAFQAGKDDTIPLSFPVKSRTGGSLTSISVGRGQRIMLSFDGFNRHPAVWGSDADIFRPERWLDNQEHGVSAEYQCGGLYANLANFGAGPKACLGWRFAVIEMQAFVASLVCAFEISMADPTFELWKEGAFIVTTPMRKSHVDGKPQMPLRIRRRKEI